jgi:preprotein translocase subunit SecA
MITRAIENAQRKVEGHNFDIRKHLLEYDDVMNKQREIIYSQRRSILNKEDVKENILDMLPDLVEPLVFEFADEKLPSEDWDWKGLSERMHATFGLAVQWDDDVVKDLKSDSLRVKLNEIILGAYQAREKEIGSDNMRHLERVILLQVVDSHWKEHLLNMDHLKEGIGLRGYGQKNPLNEYKKEGFEMFQALMETIKQQTVSTLFMVRLVQKNEVEELERRQREKEKERARAFNRSDDSAAEAQHPAVSDKIGRNASCPCGSGKKYKRCCGQAK